MKKIIFIPLFLGSISAGLSAMTFVYYPHIWTGLSFLGGALVCAYWAVRIVKINGFLLSTLSEGEMTLYSCDGSEIIADAWETFKGYIDPDFRHATVGRQPNPTPDTQVGIYQTNEYVASKKIFDALPCDPHGHYLSQQQIRDFCLRFPDRLQGGGLLNLFMFKEGKDFFVAGVRVESDGLRVFKKRLNDSYKWEGGVYVFAPVRKWSFF